MLVDILVAEKLSKCGVIGTRQYGSGKTRPGLDLGSMVEITKRFAISQSKMFRLVSKPL